MIAGQSGRARPWNVRAILAACLAAGALSGCASMTGPDGEYTRPASISDSWAWDTRSATGYLGDTYGQRPYWRSTIWRPSLPAVPALPAVGMGWTPPDGICVSGLLVTCPGEPRPARVRASSVGCLSAGATVLGTDPGGAGGARRSRCRRAARRRDSAAERT